MLETLETCQNCKRRAPIDAKGRVVPHTIVGTPITQPPPVRDHYAREAWRNTRQPLCMRSGHPSDEELARRKAAREAKRQALVAELSLVAPTALDALIEGRTAATFCDTTIPFAARYDEFMYAALYLFNQTNLTRYDFALRDGGAVNHCFWCRFCKARLSVPMAIRTTPRVKDAVSLFKRHILECSLAYLAGLRGSPV